MNNNAALILIDIQNDFCHGGRLAVPDGEAIVPVANRLRQLFRHVIATKDWHPAEHLSFAANHVGGQVGEVIELNGVQQMLWPSHCVQESWGSDFHSALQTDFATVIYKGEDIKVDSYSAFFDNARLHATGLHDYLKQQAITTIYMMGLATDYCVKFSVLDALALGFRVYLIKDGCRGVNINPGESDKAIQEMQASGAIVLTSEEIMQQVNDAL